MTGARFARLGSFLVAVIFLLPAVSSAQSAIAGLVTDATGAILPGVYGRGAQSCVDRADADRGVGRQRPVPDRRPAARHLQRDVFAPGLQPFRPRRDRARVELHGTHQRTAQGRQPRRDGDGLWRSRLSLTCRAPRAAPCSRRNRWKCCRRAEATRAWPPRFLRLARRLAGRFDVGGSTQMWQGTVVGLWFSSRGHGARGRRHERRQHPQHGTDFRHLPQSERLRRDVLSGGRGLCRVADRRRPDQHDPEAGRQQIHLGRRRHVHEREPAGR